jgi:hypothetical protein
MSCATRPARPPTRSVRQLETRVFPHTRVDGVTVAGDRQATLPRWNEERHDLSARPGWWPIPRRSGARRGRGTRGCGLTPGLARDPPPALRVADWDGEPGPVCARARTAPRTPRAPTAVQRRRFRGFVSIARSPSRWRLPSSCPCCRRPAVTPGLMNQRRTAGASSGRKSQLDRRRHRGCVTYLQSPCLVVTMREPPDRKVDADLLSTYQTSS